MKIGLIGSRWFGEQMLRLLRERGDTVFVVAPNADDRLAIAAEAAGVPLSLLNGRRHVAPDDLPQEVDVIVSAHAHAFTPPEVREKARLAAIGYHPSLLPRHRGIAAVEWTIRSGDPIAGGSIYHLNEDVDGGPLAAQDWCFVYPDDDAGSLWRRALAPLGQRLLVETIEFIEKNGYARSYPQDQKAVTYAPSLKKVATGT